MKSLGETQAVIENLGFKLIDQDDGIEFFYEMGDYNLTWNRETDLMDLDYIDSNRHQKSENLLKQVGICDLWEYLDENDIVDL